MAAWIVPATWVSGTQITAAQMNAEVRDHLTWLKAALDLITRGSDSDSGNSTFLAIERASSGTAVLAGRVTGDTDDRLQLLASGSLKWGSGAGTVETTLERDSAGTLRLWAATTNAQLRLRGSTSFSALGFEAADSSRKAQIDIGTGGSADFRFLVFTGAAGAEVAAEVMRVPSTAVFGRAATDTPLVFYRGSSASVPVIQIGSSGASQERWGVYADGSMKWGGGLGTNLSEIYRSGALAYTLVMSPLVLWPSAIVLPTNGGAINDAVFSGLGIQSGLIGIDTTNSRIYVRVGSTWKSVAVA